MLRFPPTRIAVVLALLALVGLASNSRLKSGDELEPSRPGLIMFGIVAIAVIAAAASGLFIGAYAVFAETRRATQADRRNRCCTAPYGAECLASLGLLLAPKPVAVGKTHRVHPRATQPGSSPGGNWFRARRAGQWQRSSQEAL